jgi:hypothetical protein
VGLYFCPFLSNKKTPAAEKPTGEYAWRLYIPLIRQVDSFIASLYFLKLFSLPWLEIW